MPRVIEEQPESGCVTTRHVLVVDDRDLAVRIYVPLERPDDEVHICGLTDEQVNPVYIEETGARQDVVDDRDDAVVLGRANAKTVGGRDRQIGKHARTDGRSCRPRRRAGVDQLIQRDRDSLARDDASRTPKQGARRHAQLNEARLILDVQLEACHTTIGASNVLRQHERRTTNEEVPRRWRLVDDRSGRIASDRGHRGDYCTQSKHQERDRKTRSD